MKIQIKNFGPISNFEFDLSKDLNVIFGKNNIGKSYAISVIYLILKNLLLDRNVFRRVIYDSAFESNLFFYGMRGADDKHIKEAENLLKKIKSELKEKNIDEVNITKDVKKIFISIINSSFVLNLEKSLQNSFSSIDNLNNRINNKEFTITLSYKSFRFTLKVNDRNKLIVDELHFEDEIFAKRAVRNRKPVKTENRHILYIKDKDVNGYVILQFALNNYVRIFKDEVHSHVNSVYFLPASRSGLYQALSTFSAVIAELSKSRTFVTQKIELPTISEPVSDYFLFLSRIQGRANKKYSEVVSQIEKEILKGEVLFDKDSGKIVFSQNDIKTQFDLSFTSSMISEIAPIVAYLKYIIANGQENVVANKTSTLIFIEEPEAHLHPEIQVKIIELFAAIARLDIKVVMTSHSNYMLNKLSNLLLKGDIDYNKIGSYLMKMTPEGSTIDTISMRAEKDGIVDENFVDIAEDLYDERINIYNELNSANDK